MRPQTLDLPQAQYEVFSAYHQRRRRPHVTWTRQSRRQPDAAAASGRQAAGARGGSPCRRPRCTDPVPSGSGASPGRPFGRRLGSVAGTRPGRRRARRAPYGRRRQDVDPGSGVHQLPHFVGLGGEAVLHEAPAVDGGLAEGRTQGDRAGPFGGVQLVGVQVIGVGLRSGKPPKDVRSSRRNTEQQPEHSMGLLARSLDGRSQREPKGHRAHHLTGLRRSSAYSCSQVLVSSTPTSPTPGCGVNGYREGELLTGGDERRRVRVLAVTHSRHSVAYLSATTVTSAGDRLMAAQERGRRPSLSPLHSLRQRSDTSERLRGRPQSGHRVHPAGS